MIDAPIKNYTEGRGGYEIEGVVLHITEGSVKATLSHFGNPKSLASSHYLVAPNAPHIIKLVDEKNTAWHAGKVVRPTWKGLKKIGMGSIALDDVVNEFEQYNGEKGHDFIMLDESNLGGACIIVNPNKYTIGIEVALPDATFFPKMNQWKATAWITKDILQRNNLPIDRVHIAGHNEIRADKLCPGKFITPNWIISLTHIIK
ncbi:MAG: N-acetylmuramoyl-L-alanine amidase [Bacteroidetes bacterium]|nr:N-acetylmuramoyl-L-alanine amidase [Bacteroidota bacterium]